MYRSLSVRRSFIRLENTERKAFQGSTCSTRSSTLRSRRACAVGCVSRALSAARALAATASAGAPRPRLSTDPARSALRCQRTGSDPHRAIAFDHHALRRLIVVQESPHDLFGVAARRNRRRGRELDNDLGLLIPVCDLEQVRSVALVGGRRHGDDTPNFPVLHALYGANFCLADLCPLCVQPVIDFRKDSDGRVVNRQIGRASCRERV